MLSQDVTLGRKGQEPEERFMGNRGAPPETLGWGFEVLQNVTVSQRGR